MNLAIDNKVEIILQFFAFCIQFSSRTLILPCWHAPEEATGMKLCAAIEQRKCVPTSPPIWHGVQDAVFNLKKD